MDALYRRCAPFLETRFFSWLFTTIMLLNPIGIFPQVYSAFTAPTVVGISVTSWFVFFLIQTASMLYGIKTKSFGLFLSMALSMLESTTIIITVLYRS